MHPVPVYIAIFFVTTIFGGAQNPAPDSPGEAESDLSAVPERVEVDNNTSDYEISSRLKSILAATGWFENPTVRVDEGVVFLSGSTSSTRHREWAGSLAAKTNHVVAVVNQIEVETLPFWNLTPAWKELRELVSGIVRQLPHLVAGFLCLILAYLVAGFLSNRASILYRKRFRSQFLADVARRATAVLIFLFGVFIALRISGLTGIAMTVLGGTGLIGLAVGFAFRDIAENFLASVLISIQQPFSSGDRIQVAGYDGFVQSVNTRATLLMTLDGNHVQIPNATIYKETITNFTANPNSRFHFSVGIGYEDRISEAQSIIQDVLQQHPAVVQDSEMLVLVDSLGAATINLKVYFWVNIADHSGPKVRSAIIRMSKIALDRAGISMPDEAREVVFPDGVPVQMLEEKATTAKLQPEGMKEETDTEEQTVAHSAEGNLSSESTEIEQQAKQSTLPESGKNLLEKEGE